MSTGMANEEEISEAVETARINGAKSILLFHCISSYPAPTKQANLRQILNLKEKFGVAVGLSDHTIGNTCAVGAISIGACAIEKHFTLNRADKGLIVNFQWEPKELLNLVQKLKLHGKQWVLKVLKGLMPRKIALFLEGQSIRF